jgi:hypothetical protein
MNKTHSQKLISLAAVLRAVQECRAKPLGDPQRIVVLLAPAGFGLPLPYRHTLRYHGAVLVPAGQLDQNRLRFLKTLAHHTRIVPLPLCLCSWPAPASGAPGTGAAPWNPPKSDAEPTWLSNSSHPHPAMPNPSKSNKENPK